MVEGRQCTRSWAPQRAEKERERYRESENRKEYWNAAATAAASHADAAYDVRLRFTKQRHYRSHPAGSSSSTTTATTHPIFIFLMHTLLNPASP